MLQDIKDFIEGKYKLKCVLDVDLKIYSDNVLDTIVVMNVCDTFIIKYNNKELKTSKNNIIKYIDFLLERLAYIYFISYEGVELKHITYDPQEYDTILDCAEEYLWQERDNIGDVYNIFVMSFKNLYSFEAKVSGSFIDTYRKVYDEEHYKVYDASTSLYKYIEKDYALKNKPFLTKIINNKYNLEEMRKFFLKEGYFYLLDYKDRDTHDIYLFIDFDIDTMKTLATDKFMIITPDFKSVLDYEENSIYIRGDIQNIYPTIEKEIQVDTSICSYIHSVKTSRINYLDNVYEASAKNIYDELNKLNQMLDRKILCCFFCKYGNYLEDPTKIYCLKGFDVSNFSDVVYNVFESKMIPYDMFNLCVDFNYQTKKTYTHTKALEEEK